MAAAEVEPALVREHAIRLGDGVVMNPEIDRELPYRRERRADRKRAGDQMGADGIRDLAIGGHGGGEVDADDRG